MADNYHLCLGNDDCPACGLFRAFGRRKALPQESPAWAMALRERSNEPRKYRFHHSEAWTDLGLTEEEFQRLRSVRPSWDVRRKNAVDDKPHEIEGRTPDKIIENYERCQREENKRLVKHKNGWYVQPMSDGHGGLTRRQYAFAQIEWQRRLKARLREAADYERHRIVVDMDWD